MHIFRTPEILLKNIVSYLAAVLIAMLIFTVTWSQIGHLGSKWFGWDYAQGQSVHYQFACRPQVGSETPTSGNSGLIRHRYFALMEVTRQEVSPTDFAGKFQRFLLCSSFSRVGVGSVQLAATGSGSFFFDEMHVEEAQIRRGEFASIMTHYPDVPPYLSEEIVCLLGEMAQGKSDLNDETCKTPVAVETNPSETQTTTPDPNPTAEDKPGPFILISGADQSDASALNEVRTARAILGGMQGTGLTEVFLIRSWRRTVTYFDSEVDAKAALEAKNAELPYGGYVRNTATWCNAIPTDIERTTDGVRFWRCKE